VTSASRAPARALHAMAASGAGGALVGGMNLQQTVAFNVDAGDPTYLFDLAKCPADPSVFAASASNHRVKVYDFETMKLTRALPARHTSRITGLSFGHTSPHLLWSCSEDPSIAMWDLRSGDCELVYDAAGAVPSCLGVSCDDAIVGVGSNLVEEDAPVLLFDVREAKHAHALVEAHSDDVTAVSFHPTAPGVCCTGSTDGLVNVVDVTQMPDEDEAIVQTLNSDSSVSKVGFFGPAAEYVYALTHTETFLIWHSTPREDDDEPELIASYDELREGLLADGVNVEYFVDAVYNSRDERLFLIGGTHEGDISLLHVNLDTIELAASLLGGHAATVRAVHWDFDNTGAIVSGAEDARLALWSDAPPAAPRGRGRAAAAGKMSAASPDGAAAPSKLSKARAMPY